MNKLFFVSCAVLWIMFVVGPLVTECFAEEFMLEEIIVQGEREFSPEESIDIRDIRETPARDLGEALDEVDGGLGGALTPPREKHGSVLIGFPEA